MKYISLLLALLTLQSCLIGAGENSKIEVNKNNFFPKIIGIDLNGNKQELPQAFEGKLNIVVVAFKREQQSEVDTWIKGAGDILSKNPEVRLYEVPLIYELNSFKRAWVNNGMRFGIQDEQARKRTITVYTNRDEFFTLMKMREEEIYTLLLDDAGKILWQASGVANEDSIKLLDKVVFEYKK